MAKMCLLKTVFVTNREVYYDNYDCEEFTIGDNHIRARIAKELWRIYESQQESSKGDGGRGEESKTRCLEAN